jgi:hypothetical protein
MLKEKFGSHTRKTFSRFTTKDGYTYTWNSTYNMESMKLEARGVGVIIGSRKVPRRKCL